MPVMDLPPIDASRCNCSATIVVGDLIPETPQPANHHRVDCVLEGARVIAIWQGAGSRAEKAAWILDPFHRRITPRSVALSYAFFRSRCVHVSVFAGIHANGIMRHANVCGWSCDTSRIFELGWSLACRTTWTGPDGLIGKEHRRILLVVPENLHRLKFAAGGAKDLRVFFYREFKEIHLKKTNLFDNNIGHVIFVFPSVEPKPGTWLPVVHAVNMWLRCGVRLYLIAGPRCVDENSWYRVAFSARDHINSLINSNTELAPQLVDKLPVEQGVVDTTSPCFAVSVVEDAKTWIPERQCRLFYEFLSCQLAQQVTMEKLPSETPRQAKARGAGRDVAHPPRCDGPKEGGVSKQCLRRRRQRARRSEARSCASFNTLER